ncbi:hydrolase [Gordonia phage Orla]|nr:hydrolase [Gordonia phage Orla]
MVASGEVIIAPPVGPSQSFAAPGNEGPPGPAGGGSSDVALTSDGDTFVIQKGASDPVTAYTKGGVDELLDALPDPQVVAPEQVTLESLYRPVLGTLPASVVTSDQYVANVPGDYASGWGTRWDKAGAFNYQGQNMQAVSAGNPAAGAFNPTSGRQRSNGTPVSSVIDLEFVFTGDKLDLMFQTFGYFDSQVYVEHEGAMRKIRDLPLTGNVDGIVFRSIRFAEVATRRIRVILPVCYFIQVVHEQSAIVTASPDRPLLVTTGDSYMEPVGAYNAGSARSFITYGIIEALIEATGFAVARCSQGGTGYFNDGTGGKSTSPTGALGTSPFFSNARKGVYSEYLGSTVKPLLFLVNGTINDGQLSGTDGNASATNQKNVLLEGLGSIALFDTRVSLVIVSPEPYNDSYASGFQATNRLGQIDAVNTYRPSMQNGATLTYLDASNPDRPWFTGTGSERNPAGSPQAVLTGADGIHTNYYGAQFYGRRIAAELRKVLVPADRARRIA